MTDIKTSIRMYWTCIVYIVMHKWFVFVAGRRTKAPLWRLIVHDWSKVLPSEFFPYARYFYGTELDKTTWQHDFDVAWHLHQHRHDHHWEWWLLPGKDPLPMSQAAIREMVADWMGAGRTISGKWEASTWYSKNRDRIQMHPFSRMQVEFLLREMEKRGMA